MIVKLTKGEMTFFAFFLSSQWVPIESFSPFLQLVEIRASVELSLIQTLLAAREIPHSFYPSLGTRVLLVLTRDNIPCSVLNILSK